MFGKKEEAAGSTKKVDSFIGKDTWLEGSLKTTGSVRVDGTVDGSIKAEGDVIVGEGGKVGASITARNVTVAGEVTGDIEASGRLEIVRTGKLHGDIRIMSLAVDDGAVFKGTCEMMTQSGTRVLPPPKKGELVD